MVAAKKCVCCIQWWCCGGVGGVRGKGGGGIWQDAPESKLIDCIHKTIFSNVLEAVKNDYFCRLDLCRPSIYIWRVLIVESYGLVGPRPSYRPELCLFLCWSRFFVGIVVEFPCTGVRAMVSVPANKWC